MLKYLFYLCLASLALGQFSVIFKLGSANIYAFDIFVSLFAFLGLFKLLLNKTLEVPKTYFGFLGFTLIAALSLFPQLFKISTENFILAFFYFFRWFTYLLAGIVVYNLVKNQQISLSQIYKAIIFTGLFISTAGFIQLILLPDFSVLDPTLGWDPHKNRLASTFFDPNFTGAILNLCLCILLAVDKKLLGTKSNALLVVSFLVILTSLILTFSRSSWAMFGAIVLVYGIFKFRKLLLLAFVVVFLAYFAIPRIQTRISGTTDPSDSVYFRLISWGHALTISKDNLLLGVGYDAYRFYQKDYGFFEVGDTGGHSGSGVDSSLLLVLVTTGIGGLTLFLFSFIYPLFLTFKVSREVLLIWASTSGLFIHSIFVNSLFFPQILFLWLIILSIFSYSLRK